MKCLFFVLTTMVGLTAWSQSSCGILEHLTYTDHVKVEVEGVGFSVVVSKTDNISFNDAELIIQNICNAAESLGHFVGACNYDLSETYFSNWGLRNVTHKYKVNGKFDHAFDDSSDSVRFRAILKSTLEDLSSEFEQISDYNIDSAVIGYRTEIVTRTNCR